MLTEGTGNGGDGELPPGLRDLEGPLAFELTLNFTGRLEPEEVAELDESIRGSPYLEVRRSEIVWANKGSGGAGQALFAELIQIGGQVAPGLVTAALLAGFAKVYRVARKFSILAATQGSSSTPPTGHLRVLRAGSRGSAWDRRSRLRNGA